MRQVTKDQAILIHDSKEWESWTDKEIVKFQLYQDRLCIPFERFHQAIEAVLKRPVWTHEFASVDRLRDEYLTLAPPPTLEEIFNLIPKEKLLVVNLSDTIDEKDVPSAFEECDI